MGLVQQNHLHNFLQQQAGDDGMSFARLFCTSSGPTYVLFVKCSQIPEQLKRSSQPLLDSAQLRSNQWLNKRWRILFMKQEEVHSSGQK